jgi:imidazolonepropionase-like amidohydrolase
VKRSPELFCAAGLLAVMAGCQPPALVPAARPAPPPAITPEKSAAPVAITHARLWTADPRSTRFEDATLVMRDGRIAELGLGVAIPPDAQVIDAGGRIVTPGLIDAHSHLGVAASPEVAAHDDVNEATAPITAEVEAQHSFWPQDPGLTRALAAGVTSMLVLPGSANLIGGRGFSVKNRPGRSAASMRFPGAPPVLKMACGENPKRVYGRKSGPSTRMGNVAQVRAAFLAAQDYGRRWDLWEKRGQPKGDLPPARDLRLESLLEVLRGKVLVENHCYRADEMLLMLDVAAEMGFRIRTFHHALEAYKIADVLARRGVAVATWADWWGFKMEAFDGIPENLALVQAAGGRPIVHSDSPIGIQHLNQAAAQGLAAGRAMGLALSDDDALRWVTINPAWAMGVDTQTGSLEKGKMADVVIWSGSPLSIYSHPEKVFVDGHLAYDRARGERPGDFELGILPEAP